MFVVTCRQIQRQEIDIYNDVKATMTPTSCSFGLALAYGGGDPRVLAGGRAVVSLDQIS